MNKTAVCSKCGNDSVPVKNNGDLWKHRNLYGEPCDGTRPLVDSKVKGVEKSQNYEEVEDAFANVRKDPEPVIPSGEFRYDIWVKRPCPYLEDRAWNISNGELVLAQARAAGHSPHGDVFQANVEENGNKLRVTYAVKI